MLSGWFGIGLGVRFNALTIGKETTMPKATSTIIPGASTPAPVAAAPIYKLYQGTSGSVWLVNGPGAVSRKSGQMSRGVLVGISSRPQKAKHHIGYVSERLIVRDMREFTGKVELKNVA